MKMEKFKQLRLKFEQRRSMRSQAAKAESEARESQTSDANMTPVTESPKEISETEKVKCVSMPVRRPYPVESSEAISVTATDKTRSSEDSATGKVKEAKVVSMPVKRSSAAGNEKSQPEMKFKLSKEKVVSMPVKRSPAAENEPSQDKISFKINKEKVVGMPVKRRDATEKDKSDKSKRLSADETKISGTDKRDKSKRFSADETKLSGTDSKDTVNKPEKAKHVSMPLKPKKPPEEAATPVVKIKPREHVSMPVKQSSKTEKESAQTSETDTKIKAAVKDAKSNQKKDTIATPTKTETKDNKKLLSKDSKSAAPVQKLSGTKEAVDNKDRKVQWLTVADAEDETRNEKKQIWRTSPVEGKGERKVDTLAVEGYNNLGRKSSLSEEKLQELQEAFVVFDQNRDGEITKEELGAVLYALGQRPTVTEVQALIRAVDLDKSGTIDFDEFVKIFSSKLTVDPEQELHEVFDIFDSNLDGFISDEELYAVLKKLGEQTTPAECKKMIEEADLNGDGKVDYREFKAILNSR